MILGTLGIFLQVALIYLLRVDALRLSVTLKVGIKIIGYLPNALNERNLRFVYLYCHLYIYYRVSSGVMYLPALPQWKL